jgi:hypothetical protein
MFSICYCILNSISSSLTYESPFVFSRLLRFVLFSCAAYGGSGVMTNHVISSRQQLANIATSQEQWTDI